MSESASSGRASFERVREGLEHMWHDISLVTEEEFSDVLDALDRIERVVDRYETALSVIGSRVGEGIESRFEFPPQSPPSWSLSLDSIRAITREALESVDA